MRRARDERGSVAVFTAASLLVIVSAAALAVDTGHATYRKRHLQGVADLISLDAVRAVGDRYDPTADTQTRAETFAAEAADRNGFDPTTAPNAMTVELGDVDWNTKTFTTPAAGGPDAANAVRIVLTSAVDHGFLPGTTGFTAEAIAGIDAQAGIRIGSNLARFQSSSTPFDPVLADMIGASFTAVGYDELVGADVALGDLWLGLGLGSADEVLNASVTMTELFTVTAATLNAQGDPASVAAATALTGASATLDPAASFTFGEILEIATGSPNEVAGARVNVLDLIAAAAVVANGSNLVDADLPLAIPGVADVDMKMGVIEPPKIAIGPARQDVSGTWVTRARTAQTRIRFDIELSQKLTVAGQQLTVVLPVYLSVGSATAELTGIDCVLPFESSPVDVHVVTSASTGHVGEVNDASLTGGSVTVQPGTVVSVPTLLTATATGSTTIAGGTHDLTFTGPFDEPPPPETRPTQTVGAGSPGLDDLSSAVTVTVTPAPGMGLIVNAGLVATQIEGMLDPVIERLDSDLVDVIVGMPLGFRFGGADVTNTSLNCDIRRLAG